MSCLSKGLAAPLVRDSGTLEKDLGEYRNGDSLVVASHSERTRGILMQRGQRLP